MVGGIITRRGGTGGLKGAERVFAEEVSEEGEEEVGKGSIVMVSDELEGVSGIGMMGGSGKGGSSWGGDGSMIENSEVSYGTVLVVGSGVAVSIVVGPVVVVGSGSFKAGSGAD